MRVTLERFSGLVSGIYDAALDASQWHKTLKELVAAFGGSDGAFMMTAHRARQAVQASIGQDHAAVANYNGYYGRMDPVAAALEQAPAGAVLGCWDIVAPGEQRHSEFFVDWAAPIDMGDGIFANIVRDGGNIGWLGIGAPFGSEPFAGPGRKRLLRLLLPHLQQAMRAQSRLGALDLERQGAFEAFDRLAHGVVLFDYGGSVLFANRAAMRISAALDGLTVDRAGIRAVLRDEDATLQRLIGRASGKDGSPRAGGTMAVARPFGAQPLVVHVLPTSADEHGLSTTSAIAVIVDPDREPRALAPMLRRLYKLTAAEATVACEVLRGEGLQSVADKMSLLPSTVRTHLQRVFDKTGTHRQAELARLLLTIEAGLEPHDAGQS